MAGRAGSGETESAGANRVRGNFAHLGDIGLVGVFQPDGSVTHDKDPNGGVGQQRA